MLYSEFVENTGCKDKPENYEVYKNLEIMYMNSELPKSVIYEYGKKLVDNSLSEKELEARKEAQERHDYFIEEAKQCDGLAQEYKEKAKLYREWAKSENTTYWKQQAKIASQCAREYTIAAKHKREYARWAIA